MTTTTPVPVARRSALRLVPLAIVWLAAAWPVVLYAVHCQDPEAAVRLAQIAWLGVARTFLGGGALLVVALVVFPPAPAWLRLTGNRMLRSLTTDSAPLRRALADLQHFESAARHLDAGRLALQSGKIETAAPHLLRAVELDPTLPGAQHQLGLLLFRLHGLPAAFAAFRTAERLDPGHAFGEALLHAGRCAFLLGDVAGAVQLLQQHQRTHGGGRRSHCWLADALAANGDAEGARAALGYAAAPVTQRLTAEENWFRALARVRLWRRGARP